MNDRQIRVNAFDMNCPTHLVAGTWRAPESRASEYKDLAYWTDLARLAERGVFAGSNEGALRGGAQVPVNAPSLVGPAMAAVTEHLGFGITASTSFEHPYT